MIAVTNESELRNAGAAGAAEDAVTREGEVDPPQHGGADESRSTRRVRLIAVAAYLVFAVIISVYSGLRGLIGLTCSAAVAMINFLWLEDIVVRVLQPAPRVSAWRMGVRTLARFALFGVALSVSIFVVRFDALSVLLGFSIIVVGIMGEALYSAWKSF